MGIQFAEHDDVVFDKAPLVNVLCQIRFPPVLSLLNQAGVTGFQSFLRDAYPIMMPPERTANVALTDVGIGVQAAPAVWRLVDESGKWTVGLNVEFVSLETTDYVNIEGFLERLQQVLKALSRTIRPADSLRVGLRKVNRIYSLDIDNVLSFDGMIRPEILGPLAANSYPVPVSGWLSQLEFTEDFNKIVVRTALETSERPPSLYLDLDYFTEQPYSLKEGPELMSLLHHFSEGMTSFFHWATTDEYRTQLGPSKRIDVKASS